MHIGVARGLAAALQAGLAVTAFACCRQLGVRRSLAAAGAAASIAIAQPFWPIASPHWLASLLVQLLLLALLAMQQRPWQRRWLARGAIIGALAATQQQKAVPFAVLGAVVIAFDAATSAPAGRRWRAAAGAAGAFALGVLAVLGPVMGIAVAQAGFGPVFDGLVRFPLVQYHRANQAPWGWTSSPTGSSRVRIVRALPWVLTLLGATALRGAARRDWRGIRATVVLLATGIAAAASILYNPDVVHLAFIAGIFVIALADCLERGLQFAARGRPGLRRLAPWLAAAGLLWSGYELERVAAWARGNATARIETAFGTVAANTYHIHNLAYPLVQAMVDRDPDRRLLVYPWMSSLYLMTGGRNPTPYQCMQAGYLSAAQVERAIAAVDAARVRTIVVSEWNSKPDPALARYLADHYRPVLGPLGFPSSTVYERVAP
ncbi:MAG: hypothetical protein U0802_08625 [Candidatus Binatia bacterium]